MHILIVLRMPTLTNYIKCGLIHPNGSLPRGPSMHGTTYHYYPPEVTVLIRAADLVMNDQQNWLALLGPSAVVTVSFYIWLGLFSVRGHSQRAPTRLIFVLLLSASHRNHVAVHRHYHAYAQYPFREPNCIRSNTKYARCVTHAYPPYRVLRAMNASCSACRV